ncbi:tripartite tricarboxylate transporter substrate binding protein [Bordetella sp. BOR01]|uniref:tripartite tricarboxylate transporter substrate binding protein n=1 Tax=Bordetella sp. BOR01 TaxID=2854779 RepID=UPI001C443741|nr:tripartite tricarboxylate transporter substrate binding protein [Bordetella sp. BOR01]MBV7482986.1 tripartite tricarboxylate transporter substrate binding protein [Bordetella sp. BOR01]
MLITAIAAVALAPAVSAADSFPDHPIQLYVPFGAGGSFDLTARALAKAAEKELGSPVVVVNKPGAGGAIALGEVARAQPDGYTIGVFTAANAVIAPQIQKVTYDPLKDFSLISNYATSTLFVAVRADSPYQTLDDMLADMKARPGDVMVGVSTIGSSTHLSTARMMLERGLQTEYVTFGGGAQVLTALMGGHIPVASVAGEALPYVTSGKIRFLASFSRAPIPGLPDVPWIGESGFKWEADAFVGLAAPKELAEPRRALLEKAFLHAAEDPDYLRVVQDMAMLPNALDGKTLQEILGQSYQQTGTLVKAVGLAQQK